MVVYRHNVLGLDCLEWLVDHSLSWGDVATEEEK